MIDLGIGQYALFLLAGLVAGFLNVIAGGGSLITVPLMIFNDIPAPVANGTNRIALLAQNISATTTFIKKGYKDLKLSISLSLCALPGGIVGAMIGVEFDGVWFNRTIAIIMIAVMFITLYKPKKKNIKRRINPIDKLHSKFRLVLGHFLMLGIGFYGGVIQMGIGFLFPFVLHKIMGIDLVRCNMHKVFIILIYTVASLIIFASESAVIWSLGIFIAIGNSVGAYFGARASIDKGERLIVWILNITLVIFAIKLLFFS